MYWCIDDSYDLVISVGLHRQTTVSVYTNLTVSLFESELKLLKMIPQVYFFCAT